jgi:hypothetical protein
MTVRSREDWERLVARGQQEFLLRNGVLRRGLPLGILLGVVLELYLGGRFPDSLASVSFWARTLLCVAVFSTSGVLRSLALWNAYRRRYETLGAGRPRTR